MEQRSDFSFWSKAQSIKWWCRTSVIVLIVKTVQKASHVRSGIPTWQGTERTSPEAVTQGWMRSEEWNASIRALEMSEAPPRWTGHFMALHHHLSFLLQLWPPLSLSSLFLTCFSLFFLFSFFFRREIFDICLCYKEKLGAWLLAFACSYIRDFLYCFGALHQNHSENGWVSKTKGWRNCSCRRRKGAEILGHSQGKKLFSPSKAPTMMDAILGLVNSRDAVCS